jgi:hypothetical protein
VGIPTETIDYGKLNKRIVFTDNDHRHAQLLVRLRTDGLSQAVFFRAVVGAYIAGDIDIQSFVDKLKTQSIKRKTKSKNLRRSGAKKVKDLALNEGEIENIFDILAEEHPDL